MKSNEIKIQSDGLQLQARFYQADGDGLRPTLLLIHGWPGSPENVVGLGERQMERDDRYASAIRAILRTTQAPEGPVRFDLEHSLQELIDGREVYGLQENADRLADRAILLFGAWEDENTTVEDFMLPLYRSLKSAGAGDVTFIVYHDDHGFGQVRDRLAADISDWIGRETPR